MNGKDIKEHRNNKGWTQTYLAKKIGVGVRTIQNYENGGVVPESKHEILRLVFFNTNDKKTQNILKTKYLEKDGVKISLREIATFVSRFELAMETDELYRQFKDNIKKDAIIQYYESKGFNSDK